MISAEDKKTLDDLLEWLREHDPDEALASPKPFEEMLARDRPLTEKQRRWARGLLARVTDTPVYENLVSRGLVPLGKPVPTPAVLQNLPRKPPVKRTS